MLVELIFHKNLLDLNAKQIQERIKLAIKKELDFEVKIVSTTIMNKWLVVLIELNKDINYFWDAVAGLIVCEFVDYEVRYCNFEIHGQDHSLIYKKDWSKK